MNETDINSLKHRLQSALKAYSAQTNLVESAKEISMSMLDGEGSINLKNNDFIALSLEIIIEISD